MLAALALSAVPVSAAVDELRLMSRASGPAGAGGDDHSVLVPDGWSSPQSRISADGRFVAFDSSANNLSVLQDDAWPNGFLREEAASDTRMLNPHVPGTGAGHAAISADGTRAAFVTPAALSIHDENGDQDVYACDLPCTGAPMLVSRAGTQASSGWAPSLSASGSRIAYHDPSGGGVFVRDVGAQTTTLVSRTSGAAGAAANGNVAGTAISGDGRHVAFVTDATNLDPADGAPDLDIYVRDLEDHTTELVSRGLPAVGSPYAFRPAISADGQFVVFEAGDAFFQSSAVFVRDRELGVTALASVGIQSGSSPSISADGRHVGFTGIPWLGGVHAFVREMPTDRTALVTRLPGGDLADGRSFWSAVSGNGEYVAFEVEGGNLSDIDDDAVNDVFRARYSFGDAPVVTITTPADGAEFARDSAVLADYECTDASGSGLFACSGPVLDGQPIDTSTPGVKEFTVIAQDNRGNQRFATHRYTVTGDLPDPELSIADVEVDEDEGLAVFTVSLLGPRDGPVSVHYETADDSAEQPGDYTAAEGDLVFDDDADPLTETIPIEIADDTVEEPLERFTVTLSNPVGATIDEGVAVGTIRDDDGAVPELRIADITVNEGNSGATIASFTVTLAEPGDGPVTVDYATADDSARVEDGDYAAASGTVTLAPGQTRDNTTVSVTVRGDLLDEPDERFTVELTNPTNATIADGQGVGVIRDDDPAPPRSCPPDIGYAEVVECSIDVAGETDAYSLPGLAGHRVRARAIRSSGDVALQLKVNRDDTTICQTTFVAGELQLDCLLTGSGSFGVVVQGSGAGTGEYRLHAQRLNPPAECAGTLTAGGAPVPGAIVQAPESECHPFAGAVGERVRLRLLRTAGSALFEVEVFRPDGTRICHTTFVAAELELDCGPLDAEGTHHVLVQAQGGGTGEYLLSAEQLDGDRTPPQVTITTPPDGAEYQGGAVVVADYECSDEPGGSGLASCVGTVADGGSLDTATLGVKDFTVIARDNAGNERSVTRLYRITPGDFSAPRITITAPQAGAGYPRGAVVLADYECADEAGGSGLASCAGPVADGEPIDTATLGGKSFTVVSLDNAGNRTSVTAGYLVIDVTRPTISLRAPPDGATYFVGQVIAADYECADDAGGSGIASCAGPVADGGPIDTATPGRKSFTVIGRDNAGNQSSVTHDYDVVERPLCDGVPATIVVPPGSGPVTGTPAADVIVGSAGGDDIRGAGGRDRICGRGGADDLNGQAGNDHVSGGRGADRLNGGRRDDALLGGVGDDTLEGGSGADTVRGGAGADRLRGEQGDDRLAGNRGNDRLLGGAGDDGLDGGPGRDFCRGGEGSDTDRNCES